MCYYEDGALNTLDLKYGVLVGNTECKYNCLCALDSSFWGIETMNYMTIPIRGHYCQLPLL